MRTIFLTMILTLSCFAEVPVDSNVDFGVELGRASSYWNEGNKEAALKVYEDLIAQTVDPLLVKVVALRKGLLEDEMGLSEAAAKDIYTGVKIADEQEVGLSSNVDMSAVAVSAILKKSAELKALFLNTD